MTDVTTPVQAPHNLERRLATILCADVAGYSRMMGEDEERTVRVFRGHREIFESLVAQHRGRIFNTAGDALLAEFTSAVEAVRCATDIQAALRTRNEHLAPEERMQFRIGVNLGDVIVQGGDLLGDGVNVAARIQQATEPGGICISGSVHEQIQNKLSLDFKLLGELPFKNIAKPIRTYTINEGAAVTRPARKTPTTMAVAVAASIVAVAGAAYWGFGELQSQRAERERIEAQLVAQKQAAADAQRATEEVKREAQAQAQAMAAQETLRRAQEERGRVEQERKLFDAERRTAEAAKKQPAAAPVAGKAAAYDGLYNGRMCNHLQKKTDCWPLALSVRDGAVEGEWLSRSKQTATAHGTVSAEGAVRMTLAAWRPNGDPTEASLFGRLADGQMSVSGKWREGTTVTGDWRRGAMASAAPVSKASAQAVVRRDGRYEGGFCNDPPNKEPVCWKVELVAHDGTLEGSWRSRSGNTARASGRVAPDGRIEMKLDGWTPGGKPLEASLAGRLENDALKVSGEWRDRTPIRGDWKRAAKAER